MTSYIPSRLLDASTLAVDIWSYWTNIMYSDGVLTKEEATPWSQLDSQLRERFIESVKANVCAPLKSVESNVNFESSLDSPYATVKDSTCYSCGEKPVSGGGKVCIECYVMYVKENA